MLETEGGQGTCVIGGGQGIYVQISPIIVLSMVELVVHMYTGGREAAWAGGMGEYQIYDDDDSVWRRHWLSKSLMTVLCMLTLLCFRSPFLYMDSSDLHMTS